MTVIGTPVTSTLSHVLSVLAAVMPAPRVPVEIREFPEPESAARWRAAPDRALRSVRHRRAPVARPARRACRIRSFPGHVTTGTLDAVRGRSPMSTARRSREGDRVAFFDVHRTCGRCLACTVHRTPTRCPSRRVYGITDSATEGLFGGWAQKVYLEPGVDRRAAAGRGDVRGLHRRRLRAAHGGAHHRARADRAGRHRRRAGRRRGRA